MCSPVKFVGKMSPITGRVQLENMPFITLISVIRELLKGKLS